MSIAGWIALHTCPVVAEAAACVCVGRPWIAMVQPGQDPSSSPRSVERLHGAQSSKLNGQTASDARPSASLLPCIPPTPFLLPLSIPIRERRHRHGFVQFWQAAGVAPKMSQRLEQQRRRHLGACSCYGLEGGGCRGRGDRARHSGKALKSLDIPVQKCLFLLFTLMRSAINRRRLPSTRAYVYIPCLYPT